MTGPNPNKQAVELNRALFIGASINFFVLAFYFQVISSININLIGVFYVKYWSDSLWLIGLVGGLAVITMFVIYLWFIPGLGSSL
jgi:hypothetical protein